MPFYPYRCFLRRNARSVTSQLMTRNAKLTTTGIQIAAKYDCPYMPYRSNSTMYVKGDTMAIALAQAGSAARGMKTPLMNKIGNRKKFISVIASKTSLTITEAIRPSRENVRLCAAIQHLPPQIELLKVYRADVQLGKSVVGV